MSSFNIHLISGKLLDDSEIGCLYRIIMFVDFIRMDRSNKDASATDSGYKVNIDKQTYWGDNLKRSKGVVRSTPVVSKKPQKTGGIQSNMLDRPVNSHLCVYLPQKRMDLCNQKLKAHVI